MEQQPNPRRRGSNTWIIFAVAAVAVLAYGIWQNQKEGGSDDVNPPPAATPGAYRLIDFKQAMEDAGLKTEIIRASFRSPQFSVPGQGIEVDGSPVYLFIYPGPDAVAAREEESKDLDPATIAVTTISGTPVVSGELHVVYNSNVIAVMPSASQDVTDKVDQVIEGLS